MRRLVLLSALAFAAGCDEGDPQFGFVPRTLPASQLTVAVQPSDAASGLAISPPVQIQVRNANGQLMTGSTATVTMSITPGTGTAGAVMTGQLIVSAVNGVATFNNLRIALPGTGYTLTASSPGLAATTTAPFNITP
jgi:hypothetical protein